MADKANLKKRPISADWFVQGLLTRLGDAFDRLTGRKWKPSSSLATSELAERLKRLVEKEARDGADGRKFVPHNIQLKMQWDKFSSDSENGLRQLEIELLTSLVDYINDRRYYTNAPLSLKVKPDYFTDGVKLFASFDESDEGGDEEGSLNVTLPDVKIDPAVLDGLEIPTVRMIKIALRYEVGGEQKEKIFEMLPDKRLSIGRTPENDIALDDESVSKMHASLVMNKGGELLIADTGSTNGTFVGAERIPYGKAIAISTGQDLRFGTIAMELEVIERIEPEQVELAAAAVTETYKVGDLEFSSRTEGDIDVPVDTPPAPTLPAVPMPKSQILKPIDVKKPATESQNGHAERQDEEPIKS